MIYFILTMFAEWFGFIINVPAIGVNPNMAPSLCAGYAVIVVNGKTVTLPFMADCQEQLQNPGYLTVRGIWWQLRRMGFKPISVEIRNKSGRKLYQENKFFPVLKESW